MADKPLFLVTFRHPHSNEIEHAVECMHHLWMYLRSR